MKKIVYLLLATCIINLAAFAQTQPGIPSATFNAGDIGYPTAERFMNDGFVSTMQVNDFDTLSNGKIIAVGNFTLFNGISVGRIAKLTRDGNIDTTFNYALPGANYEILSVRVTPQDSIIIAGNFTTYNGVAANGIALIDSTGNIDMSFANNVAQTAVSNATTVNIDHNGNYIIATKVGISNFRLFKISKTGFSDFVFESNTGLGAGYSSANRINKIYVDNNNRIIIVGLFFYINNAVCPKWIVRLNNDGTRDTSFTEPYGAGGNPYSQNDWGIYDIKPYGNDKYLLAGKFKFYGSNTSAAQGLVLINQDGTRDTSFHDLTHLGEENFMNTVVCVLPSGKIAIGTRMIDESRHRIIIVNSNGSYYDELWSMGNALFSKMIIRDGNLFMAGNIVQYDEYKRSGMLTVREEDGLPTTGAYGHTGANAIIKTMIDVPDGDTIADNNSILIGGNFTRYNNDDYNRVVKIKPSGEVDTSFKTFSGFNGYVNALDIDTAGNIYAGGSFTTYRSMLNKGIARIKANGSIDFSFAVAGFSQTTVMDLKLLPDGKIIVGGNFILYGSTPCARIAKLLSNGNIDPSFNSGTGFDDYVLTIKILDNNTMLIGGAFTSYNGQPVKPLVKMDFDGNIISSFQPPINTTIIGHSITDIEIVDSSLYVAGYVGLNGDTVNGRNLLKLNAYTGDVDNAFQVTVSPATTQPLIKSSITTIKKQPDGKFLIGGYFKTLNNDSIKNVARILPSGATDTSFAIGRGVESNQFYTGVEAIFLHNNAKVYVGGAFSKINGKRSSSIACLNNSILLTGDPGDTLLLRNSEGVCAGSVMNVPYTAIGTFNPGNEFKIQLSDSIGGFNSPVTIGTYAATTSGTIVATVPSETTYGLNYKVRVISTSPYIVGKENSFPILLNPIPALSTSISSPDTVYTNQSNVNYAFATDTAASYTWEYSGNDVVINPTGGSAVLNFGPDATSGQLTVIAENDCGADTLIMDITVLEEVGVNENDFVKTTIYSANGLVTINTAIDGVFQLYDVSGRLLMPAKNIVQGRTDIDISGIAKGIYFVRLSNTKSAVTRKIVVSN
jgi:uncharacterized delta-60 repeat protein